MPLLKAVKMIVFITIFILDFAFLQSNIYHYGGDKMSINYVALGKRIREARKKRGLTQVDLSEKTFCTASYLSYIENGTKCISLELLIDVANELNVSADMLLFDCLANTVTASNHAFAEILNDCSEYEKLVLLETAVALKSAIRNNRKRDTLLD